ncbi:hypothetical protein Dsin_021193 [Dipteronia sinensis]|uniref:ADP/ATP translocase n=1 Tax=Dipteronia sinensis TaxID=43782 RepID=A0AAE0E4A1_9ROSI|nr:hypothetical protein Dsin_021193 [Dipteronia sinensis]
MSCKMEDKSLHPSVFLKIDWKSCLFIRNFHESGVSTPGISALLTYVPRALHGHLPPACQGTASPVFIGSPSEKRNIAPSIILSLLSLASYTVIAPVERVKLLTQCQNEMIKSGRLSHPYKGIGDCFARTIRNEGIISLWRGNTASILEQISSQIIKNALNNCFRSSFNYKKDKDGYAKRFAGILAIDSLARAITLFLVYPLQYAQTRLATDIKTANKINKRQFDGLIDVYRKTFKSDGIVGLYRGYNIALVESIVGSIVLFGTRLTLKPLLLHALGPLGLQHNILATAVGVPVELCARLPTYPLATLHRRMMMRSGEAVKYKSSLDAFSQILKYEGVKSLYKGVGVYFLKLCLLSGLAVVGGKILLKIFIIPRKNKSGKQPYRIVINWKNSKDGGLRSR